MPTSESDDARSFVVPLAESSVSLQVISMNILANFINGFPAFRSRM